MNGILECFCSLYVITPSSCRSIVNFYLSPMISVCADILLYQTVKLNLINYGCNNLTSECYGTQSSVSNLHQHLIIILYCHQHGYPWPSLATPPPRLLLPAGPQSYSPYRPRASVCRFELVALLLLGYVKGSIGIPPYFSSNELLPTSPAISCMSGLNNLDSFCDRL